MCSVLWRRKTVPESRMCSGSRDETSVDPLVGIVVAV